MNYLVNNAIAHCIVMPLIVRVCCSFYTLMLAKHFTFEMIVSLELLSL